jgi:hypothetical protein
MRRTNFGLSGLSAAALLFSGTAQQNHGQNSRRSADRERATATRTRIGLQWRE